MKPRAIQLVATLGVLVALCLAVPQAQQAGKKSYPFHGKVEKVDAKAKTLTVAGEDVKGWMGAMTMTYSVDKDDVVAKAKAGDQITATVYEGDFKTLHDVKIEPPPAKK